MPRDKRDDFQGHKQTLTRLNQLLKMSILKSMLRRWFWLLRSMLATLSKGVARRLLRSLYRLPPRSTAAEAGFVLPTAILALAIIGLLVGALVFRASERTLEVIGERQSTEIFNAATPAIERAKAKLAFLFEADPRLPSGVPTEAVLDSLLANDGTNATGFFDPMDDANDPYTFGDETRLSSNGSELNAWIYSLDLDGDGTPDQQIRYGINLRSQSEDGSLRVESADLASKVSNGLTRTGPLPIPASQLLDRADCPAPNLEPDAAGWYAVDFATLRKNFQVDVAVADGNNNVVALEYQQDRELKRGNKWAGFFRNDFETYAETGLKWNGAIHTEGSAIASNRDSLGARFYLVSAPASCFYSPENSEFTVGERQENGTLLFQGQAIASDESGAYLDVSAEPAFFDLQPGPQQAPPNTPLTENRFRRTNDSVSIDAGINAYQFTLDPIAVHTRDRSLPRGANLDYATLRAATWENSNFVQGARVFNDAIPNLAIDDTYRADDRYGPRPGYNTQVNALLAPAASNYGAPLAPLLTGDLAPLQNLLLQPATGANPNTGLDGYWERRAFAEGLRVIVSQRLELGNSFGWQGSDDPLYPPAPGSYPAPGTGGQQASNVIDRQNRTVRDNLAAVQATAVYHANATGGSDALQACVATTAHAGSIRSLENSTDFSGILTGALLQNASGGNISSASNFFLGRGTNGWEYAPPTVTGTTVAPGTALGRVLRNLATFAGDPEGAFPPVQDSNATAGDVVHPYPNLTMWGDFSELRRSLATLDGGTSFGNLSIADRTNIQTAACLLGILARNITDLTSVDYAQSGNQSQLTILAAALERFEDGDPRNGELTFTDSNSDGIPESVVAGIRTADTDIPENNIRLGNAVELGETSPYSLGDAYVPLLRVVGDRDRADVLEFLRTVEKIRRDREFGFAPTPTANIDSNGDSIDDRIFTYTITQQLDGDGNSLPPFTLAGRTYTNGDSLIVGCDIGAIEGNNYFGIGVPADDVAERRFSALAAAICGVGAPTETNVGKSSFPALYYLFPIVNHNHDGSGTQPLTEPYIDDNNSALDGLESYICGSANTCTNASLYRALSATDLATIALQPRTFANFVLPTAGAPPANNDFGFPNLQNGRCNARYNCIQTAPGAIAQVALQDRAFYQPRELMQVRALNLNLALLRDNSPPGAGTEAWLPDSGIVYAFREDAVREDAIARPNDSAWSACSTEVALTGIDPISGAVTNATANAGCRMLPDTPQDPPRDATTGASPKPVDLYPDPDRRPYGFLLSNGRAIRPPGSTLARGLTFASDQPGYVLGDFNCHGTGDPATNYCALTGAASNPRQEFTDLLTVNPGNLNTLWDNFYTRQGLNTDFARPATDNWRPVELIFDSLTLLSENFCPGVAESGIRTQNNTLQAATGNIGPLGVPASQTVCPGLTTGDGSNDNSFFNGPWAWTGDPGTGAPAPATLFADFVTARPDPGDFNASAVGVNFPGISVPDGGSATFANPLSIVRDGWWRENPFDIEMPIAIDRLGREQYMSQGMGVVSATNFKTSGYPYRKTETRVGIDVNATIAAGSLPSRRGQSNGAFENHARLIETWRNSGSNATPSGQHPIGISGSILQLFNSVYATGPFDQENLDSASPRAIVPGRQLPNQSPAQTFALYYGDGNRLGGYDIGLQYAPAGPLAERLIAPGSSRSENYQELDATDPYVARLLNL